MICKSYLAENKKVQKYRKAQNMHTGMPKSRAKVCGTVRKKTQLSSQEQCYPTRPTSRLPITSGSQGFQSKCDKTVKRTDTKWVPKGAWTAGASALLRIGSILKDARFISCFFFNKYIYLNFWTNLKQDKMKQKIIYLTWVSYKTTRTYFHTDFCKNICIYLRKFIAFWPAQ